MKILVSVIVPVYKVPLEYLRACLDSLVAQTMQECEFIVVSDGAPEAEYSVCEEFAAKDSRFKFFRREHTGVSATRNYGIEKVQGEYITFVDADDIILNNALDVCYKNAKQWDSDILVFNFASLSSHETQIHQPPWHHASVDKITELCRTAVLEQFIQLKKNSIPRAVWGKLYLKKFLNKNNFFFNKEVSIGEDLIFNLRCFSATTKISYLCETFYLYRYNPCSVTNSFDSNYFHDRILPILELKKFFPNKYDKLIHREVIAIFFQSWENCYMNSQNPQPLQIRVKKIKQIVRSEIFHTAISNTTTKDITFLPRLELFLFKNKIMFPIWLHAIKALIIKK